MDGRFFNKTPAGAVLSYPNLTGFIAFAEGGGNPRDNIFNRPGTRSGSGTPAQWGRGEESGGAAMGFTHSATSLASYVDFGTLNGWQDLGLAGNPSTLIARIYWDGTGHAGIAERNDGNTVNAGWEWGITNTGLLAVVCERGTTNLAHSTQLVVPSNRWITIASSWDGTGQTSGVKFYFDGMPQVAGTTGVTNGAGTSGTDASRSLRIGNCSFASGAASVISLNGAFGGSISWIAAFNRQLSNAEVGGWSQGAQPWMKFAHRGVRIGVLVAASATANDTVSAGGWQGSAWSD